MILNFKDLENDIKEVLTKKSNIEIKSGLKVTTKSANKHKLDAELYLQYIEDRKVEDHLKMIYTFNLGDLEGEFNINTNKDALCEVAKSKEKTFNMFNKAISESFVVDYLKNATVKMIGTINNKSPKNLDSGYFNLEVTYTISQIVG